MQQATTGSLASLGGESMGTRWSARLYARPGADLHALHAGIQQQLDQVVAQMSTWEAQSDISRYRRAAAGNWQAIPEGFAQVLDCAIEVARDAAHLAEGAAPRGVAVIAHPHPLFGSTMDTSSTIRHWMFSSTSRTLVLVGWLSDGSISRGGKPKKEWIVSPWMVAAATAVGATTAHESSLSRSQ